MADRITEKELVKRVANRAEKDADEVELIINATIKEIYESLKRQENVVIRNFGKFYIRESRTGIIFKFDPSQKLRALFGWASTYKGDL